MNTLLHPKHRAEDAVFKTPCPPKGETLDRKTKQGSKLFKVVF